MSTYQVTDATAVGSVRVYEADVTPDCIVTVFAFVPFLKMIAPARDEAVPRVSEEAPERARVVPVAAPMSGVVNTGLVALTKFPVPVPVYSVAVRCL